MNTYEKILNFIAVNGPCTVAEIGLSLDLTKADIRYHLKSLLESNLISETLPSSQKQSRGRPARRYQKISVPLPANLAEVLDLICDHLLASKPASQIAAEIWDSEIKKQPSFSTPLSRIDYTINFLLKLGVTAVWIAGKTGPQIKITRNPYNKTPQSYAAIVESLIEISIAFAKGM